MEFSNHKHTSIAKNLIFVAAITVFAAASLNKAEIIRDGHSYDNLPTSTYALWVGLFYLVFMIPLVLAVAAYDEKIVIEDGVIKFLRKQIKKYKEIDRVLISDISYIKYKPRYDYVEDENFDYIYSNMAYSIVDSKGKERFRVAPSLTSNDGISALEYLINDLKIVKRGTPFELTKAERIGKFIEKITTVIAIVSILAASAAVIWIYLNK